MGTLQDLVSLHLRFLLLPPSLVSHKNPDQDCRRRHQFQDSLHAALELLPFYFDCSNTRLHRCTENAPLWVPRRATPANSDGSEGIQSLAESRPYREGYRTGYDLELREPKHTIKRATVDGFFDEILRKSGERQHSMPISSHLHCQIHSPTSCDVLPKGACLYVVAYHAKESTLRPVDVKLTRRGQYPVL